MELRDLIVTPIIIFLVYAGAYWIRPRVTDSVNRKYFIPALTVRIIGALAVGFLYQFYYGGGDTFAYHTHGSRIIWDIFIQDPINGLQIFSSHGEYGVGLWEAAEKIWFWRDDSSFLIIQIASIFDLITFSAYSATAILFAVLSFIGAWTFYLFFYKSNPRSHKLFAISCLYIPSVVFWGSGILKDTVTLACVGVSTFLLDKLFFEKKINLFQLLILLLSFYVIFSVKKYILIGFIAAIVVWVSSSLILKARSTVLRIVLVPLVGIFCLLLSYFSIQSVMESDSKYSISKIAKTSMITAYDIRYGWGARSGDGSGYNLGELDGTWQGMIALAPEAINVAMFRPYLWEVNNPLMLLSAFESLFTLFITFFVLFKIGKKVIRYLKKEALFCLVFALIFAFGVGISTYNFGTLSRYRIPMLPFYWSALVVIYSSWKRDQFKPDSKELN